MGVNANRVGEIANCVGVNANCVGEIANCVGVNANTCNSLYNFVGFIAGTKKTGAKSARHVIQKNIMDCWEVQGVSLDFRNVLLAFRSFL